MSELIFVSHASKDQTIVEDLCKRLDHYGVTVWASFKDIPPGAPWEITIEKSLKEATYVLVAVSQACIESDFVRAEVDRAFTFGKVVIPIIIDDHIQPHDLPMRWSTVQHITWTDHTQEAPIRRLAYNLPPTIARRLESYLQASAHQDKLFNLLRQHPQWIHRDAQVGSDLPQLAGQADFYHNSAETGKTSKFFYYLGSPYQKPFESNGIAAVELKRVLLKAFRDITPIIQSSGTARLGRTVTTIHIYAGQRHHYDERVQKARDSHEYRVPQKMLQTVPEVRKQMLRIALEISNYNDLLERVRRMM